MLFPVLQAVLSTDAIHAAIKYLIECSGHDTGEPFAPAATLTDEERKDLRDRYDAIAELASPI